MTRVAVAVLALLGGTSLAFAAGPPSYDVVKTCRIVAGNTGNLAQMSYQGCMEAEQRSRSDLTRRWTSIPESIRKDCLSTEEALGSSGSYSGLKSCIDGEILYAQWQKTHPNPVAAAARTETPAPAGRRRGGTVANPPDQSNGPGPTGTGSTGTGLGASGLGTTGIGTPGTGGIGTTGTGLGTVGTGTPGLGNTGLGATGTGLGTTGTGVGTTGTGLGTTGSGTAGTGLGSSGLGTGGAGSSLGGSAGGGTAGGGSSGASGGGGGGR